MKQVVQNIKNGIVSVEDVPEPILRPGSVLVRNVSSLISAGTEGGTVKLGKKSLIGKARSRPEQVKKVLQALRTEGILTTVNAVTRTLDMPISLGYSCAGIVEATAEDVDIPIGTHVACGGAGMALHAEKVVVPQNLCAPIPDDVPFQYAAFTTVGAIAMQGVRIADVRIGENVVIIGLGLVGLLTACILKASGCRAFGIDINPQRVAWTEKNNICSACIRNAPNIIDRILEFTDGHGADAIIIAAAVESNDPVSLAGEVARHKGRVVVVGRTLMDAPRETYLFKELELVTSYAYGPGIEDTTYEVEGYDYPIGYVRWTENRNMQCFINLLSENRIDISPLITHTFTIDDAPMAFDLITSTGTQTIGVILEYGDNKEDKPLSTPQISQTKPDSISSHGPLRIGIIGAGSFATNIMVPLLAKRNDISIEAIVSANGLRAATLAKKYNIPSCTSDAGEIIDNKDIDCVFILTRHGTHAALTGESLIQGKHVFVEKPLAMTHEEIESVKNALNASGRVLMVGFNRRFSSLFNRLKIFFADSTQPMVITYRGNVGFRPPEHWLHDPVDGGGVLVGEACHYIDSCCWLTGSTVKTVDAYCVGESKTNIISEDNFMISLTFENGSIANITYVSNGSKGLGSERCEVHCENKSAVWKDFKYIRLVKGLGFPMVKRTFFSHDKGYHSEIDNFVSMIVNKSAKTIDHITSQIESSQATIAAVNCLKGDTP